MFDLGIGMALAHIEMERAAVEKARAALSPEAFKEWQAERTAERRHQQLCRSIERAGDNARPRGIGLFW